MTAADVSANSTCSQRHSDASMGRRTSSPGVVPLGSAETLSAVLIKVTRTMTLGYVPGIETPMVQLTGPLADRDSVRCQHNIPLPETNLPGEGDTVDHNLSAHLSGSNLLIIDRKRYATESRKI